MNYNKLFIAGYVRSGTTWAYDIFQHHPSVISIIEASIPILILKPFLYDNLKEQDCWNSIIDNFDKVKKGRMSAKLGYHVDKKRLSNFIDIAKKRGELTSVERAELVIKMVYDEFFICSGGTNEHLFVDKTPGNIFFFHNIQKTFPEAKFIEIIRDGRDVCASLANWGDKKWKKQSTKEKIVGWKRSIEKGLEIHSDPVFSDIIMQVKYEDLLRDPFNMVTKMLVFADIDSSKKIASKIVKKTAFKNYKLTGEGCKNYKGKSGYWKDDLSKEDIELYNKLAGDLHKKIGYSIE